MSHKTGEIYVQFLLPFKPICLDLSYWSIEWQKKEKQSSSRSPTIYSDWHEVAPRFPTVVQRLLQSPKAALHKDMQKHRQQNPHLCMHAVHYHWSWLLQKLWLNIVMPLYILQARFITVVENLNKATIRCCSIWINHAKIE
jgi:hypothetical protein